MNFSWCVLERWRVRGVRSSLFERTKNLDPWIWSNFFILPLFYSINISVFKPLLLLLFMDFCVCVEAKESGNIQIYRSFEVLTLDINVNKTKKNESSYWPLFKVSLKLKFTHVSPSIRQHTRNNTQIKKSKNHILVHIQP